MRLLLGLTLLTVTANAQWVRQKVDTTASFRGLAVVNEKIVWASGTGGTVIRTINGGKTWNVITVPGAEKLDFRDIEAFDANTAYILSIGNGDSSRIYKTIDGGETWRLEFQNANPKAFYDAIACWDSERCIAMSDPVDGSFLVTIRSPGMYGFIRKAPSWSRAIRKTAATDGEAAFAASGTCLITVGSYDPQVFTTGNEHPTRGHAFIVTGGKATRVLRSNDGGSTWEPTTTEIVRGTAGSGIFSIAMFDQRNGVIVGGNYEKPDEYEKNLAFTTDGGVTWTLGTGLSGYRSGVSYIGRNTIIAVGTNGSDITRDGGKTWTMLGKENLNAVQSKGPQATWAVGPKGMVVRLR
jgi:photosystem II stability/assembly factor-like uncharacterized protein